MNFNSLTSLGGVGTLGRVWALLGRMAGAVMGVQRMALARVYWRDLGKVSAPTAGRDETACATHLGGWWWQSPESQRTTVQRRAGV
jgi:hypothetical protein